MGIELPEKSVILIHIGGGVRLKPWIYATKVGILMDFDGLYLSGFAVLGRTTPAETRWILTSFTRWFSRHTCFPSLGSSCFFRGLGMKTGPG